MRVHVPQARNEELAAAVNDLRSGRRSLLVDGRDAIASDDNGHVGNRDAALDVYDGDVRDCDRPLTDRLAEDW